MREAELEADVVSYGAAVSACGSGGQWQQVFALFSEMWNANLEPDGIVYGAGISACGKSMQWQRALSL
eukprot:6312318-Pyramimonas_sp.AAC.1